MSIDYRIVNPADWIERALPLLQAHWDELGFGFPLAPDVRAYQNLWDAGAAFAVGAFDGDEIVGYASVVTMCTPHNSAVRFAMSDALYVRPGARCGVVSARIMQLAEIYAVEDGCSRFIWACRFGTPLAAMLEKHGYAPYEQHVIKEFGACQH